jgi:tetratricopeptide (TPR) repeat protein
MKIHRLKVFLTLLTFCLAISGNSTIAGQSPPDLAAGYREFYAGRLVEAGQIAEQLVRANPRSADNRILLARTRLVQGQIPLAYEELRRALQISPRNVDVLYHLGLVSNVMAQRQFRQLFKMAPESARAHQLLGDTYYAQKNVAHALEEYEAAVKANPELVEVWLAMGDLAKSQLQFDKAISSYAEAAELQPANYEALYGLGTSYQQQENPEKAIEILLRLVQLFPNESEGRVALGSAFLKANQPAEAVKHLEAAISIDPESSQAYQLLGRCQQALGQEQPSAESFRKARELVLSGLEDRRIKVRKKVVGPAAQDLPPTQGNNPPKEK